MKTYLVGGAVRDRLLGIEPRERDWVVLGATPEEIEALGFRRLDAEFPVFSHPESGEQYALARRERKSGAGHKGFVVEHGPDVSLEEDLRRRDLRINAMAESPDGELVDPFGGRDDLDHRVLRHVSPAFDEDPLRVLRAARFAARFAHLGFEIAEATRELMQSMAADPDMRSLSDGRIWREVELALATPTPGRFFTELEACGGLAVVLPELAAEAGPAGSFHVLDAAADPRPEIRFAALVNACTGGEPARTERILERLAQRFPVPKKYLELARIVPLLRREPATGDAETILATLESADAFRRPERFADALAVCDALDRESASPRATERLRRVHRSAAAVRGEESLRNASPNERPADAIRRDRLAAIRSSLKDEAT
ncbi:MAG: multifunctional CCA tRNA nucleotidyl transferase/2'3'-cyclic phosphodiesterase/2'nucleotidase/phosphatase [Gammaproteobacteria bacterium]|nr:multifunctional CCA tRNA nucleotidyl transferase/2'3'-cyclic phosphodiesterase/2'nucleotidase/phosphatase [Gammaproteobacteria bacterium]